MDLVRLDRRASARQRMDLVRLDRRASARQRMDLVRERFPADRVEVLRRVGLHLTRARLSKHHLERYERCRRLGSGQPDLGRPRPEVFEAGDGVLVRGYVAALASRAPRENGTFTACLPTPTKQDGCEWLNA
jgi:hypothetical protein